jgi:hypothetical protein
MGVVEYTVAEPDDGDQAVMALRVAARAAPGLRILRKRSGR